MAPIPGASSPPARAPGALRARRSPGAEERCRESIEALVAMGDAVLPSCEAELTNHPDPFFRAAGVLKVLEGIPGEAARKIVDNAARKDPFPQVRAHSLLSLRMRARTWPAEKE